MSSIFNDIGHGLTHFTDEATKYLDPIGHAVFDASKPLAGTILPIAGGVIGGIYGGPWGAAAGSSIGTGLAGGNNKQMLESGAMSYLGSSATQGWGGGTAGTTGADMGGGTGLLAGGGGTGLSAGAGDAYGGALTGAGSGAAGTSLADLTSLSGGAAAGAVGGGLSVPAATSLGGSAAPSTMSTILGALSSHLGSPKITTLIPALTTAYNSYQQSQQAKQMAQIAQQSNAFGPYRAQYAAQLNQLMQNPSQIQNTPGYQAAIQAVERQMGAGGQLGGGMEAAALGQIGGQLFQQQFNNLSSLSGANINPAVASNALLQAQQMGSQATGQMGSALASLWQ